MDGHRGFIVGMLMVTVEFTKGGRINYLKPFIRLVELVVFFYLIFIINIGLGSRDG